MKENTLKNIVNSARHEFVKAGINCDGVFSRLETLFVLEEEEDDCDPISLVSLESMLSFLYCLSVFAYPQIVMNDSGEFGLSWGCFRPGGKGNDSIVLSFSKDGKFHYVVFIPNEHSFHGRDVYIGYKEDAGDLVSYLKELGTTAYLEDEV